MKIEALDTNVLLDGPIENVFESLLEPTTVILPHVVLKELDTFKKGFEPKNEYARMATRFLEKLRTEGDLRKGVPYQQHIVKVHIDEAELDINKPDYKIIKTAKEVGAVLVTQDLNARIVADAIGVKVKGYTPDNVDVNSLYTGYTDIILDEDEIQQFFAEGYISSDHEILNNQFAELKDTEGNVIGQGICKHGEGKIKTLKRNYNAWNIKPKKGKDGRVIEEQRYAMELLLDPSVQFVSLIGPSGCGKTLLTLAAGLQQVIAENTYNKITVMRPLSPVGDDIGFLPGDKFEKLEPWMGSTFDSLEYLLEDYEVKDMDLNPNLSTREKIMELITVGDLELEAMTFVRGRSIPRQFIIIDDAQNLTQHQAATIITRAGEDAKVVFLGDLSEKQIDNHRLTPSSNGLAYVIDRFKGQDIVGHVTMKQVVRSRLAQLGVELL